jgi:hypothetical protein
MTALCTRSRLVENDSTSDFTGDSHVGIVNVPISAGSSVERGDWFLGSSSVGIGIPKDVSATFVDQH